MVRHLSESLLDPKIARFIACADRAPSRLTHDDADNIRQDLLLRILQSEHRYDPLRGTPAAFVATIAHRLRVDLQRRSFRQQCQFPRKLPSAREPPENLLDYRSPPERLELLLDIAEWLTTLTDELRELAEQLKSETLTSIARRRGTSRSTLQRQVRELRNAYDRYQQRNP